MDILLDISVEKFGYLDFKSFGIQSLDSRKKIDFRRFTQIYKFAIKTERAEANKSRRSCKKNGLLRCVCFQCPNCSQIKLASGLEEQQVQWKSSVEVFFIASHFRVCKSLQLQSPVYKTGTGCNELIMKRPQAIPDSLCHTRGSASGVPIITVVLLLTV